MTAKSYLPVTVDKSHLVTIGERLYSESIELIRELVNNAYDADATIVKVAVTPDSVSIEDRKSFSAPNRRFSSATGSASSASASSQRSPPVNALPLILRRMALPRAWYLTKKHGHRRWANGGFPWKPCRPIRNEAMARPSAFRD